MQAAGRSPQPLLLKLHHLVHETVAFFTDAVALRHPHLVKVNQPSVTGVHADLADFLGFLDAWQVHGHHHQAFVAVLRAVAGVDQHAHPVGLQAVGDPHFLAGDEVVVAVLARVAFDRSHIAARAGLAHADAAHHVAGNGWRQKFAPQFVAAKAGQRRRGHVSLHANRHRDGAAVNVAQRLGHRQRIRVIQPGTAIGLGLGQAQQAQVAELFEDLVRRKHLGGLPLVHMGVDLGVNEALEGILDFQVLVGVMHGLAP